MEGGTKKGSATETGAGAAMQGGTKERADLLLVEQGLVSSREKARALIMAGQVYEGVRRVDKAGDRVSRGAPLQIKGQTLPYVSRGGLKLAKALRVFSVSLENKVVLDIGASTGGFTDCALQAGAAKVYAVDVGYGQLDWKLRRDPRVAVLEKTNARYLTAEALGEKADFASVDVSFISLDKILPVLPGVLKEEGEGIALIKPQFEAGREQVGKKGVVRDPLVHERVLEKITGLLPGAGLYGMGLTFSPVKGPEGNIEYLLWFRCRKPEEERDAPEEGALSPEGLAPASLSPEVFSPFCSGQKALVQAAFGLLNQREGKDKDDA